MSSPPAGVGGGVGADLHHYERLDPDVVGGLGSPLHGQLAWPGMVSGRADQQGRESVGVAVAELGGAAGVVQDPAVGGIPAEEQRGRPAEGPGDAADDSVGGLPRLQFHPRPARQVGAAGGL